MNNNDENINTSANAAISRLDAREIGVNTPNAVNNSPEVHGLRTQQTPIVGQLLDNTSITIDEANSEQINNLDLINERSSSENIMEQYARYLRRQVAEVTRGRLSNIISVSRNNNLSRQNTSMQSDSLNSIRFTPRSIAGVANRVIEPESLQTFATSHNSIISTRHSNGDSTNNQVMITLSDPDSDHSSRTINSRVIVGRQPVYSSERQLSLTPYFQNNTSDDQNTLTPSNSLNQTISSRSILLEGGQEPLFEQTAYIAGSSDATIDPEETSTNELYNSVYPDVLISTLRQCLHYVPFACILLVKFIYDHFSGILDIILLQFVMYYVNKSLQSQIARIDEKKNSIILRDLFVVVATVTLRLLIASTSPDPLGLLLPPSMDERNIVHQIAFNFPQDGETSSQNLHSINKPNSIEKTVIIPKVMSLEAILYYIAVNDLILKLITIAIKLVVTLAPLRTIRHKSRTRMYIFIEFLSQFYRSLVPIRQWLLFLFESYSGLHAISGVMFSSAYIVLKGCELADRGKSLKKSLINLLKDVDKARKPVENGLDAADEVCAICQDSYVSPVVLECGHIFCDNCVTTWFKREQTCPMCRAKVGDNLSWHDGSTSFFFQLY